ncbi:MAG: hypothetical protein JSU70_21445 [Phycisphaerales bacterium]|nr:MAG: hypothetical protein JSU70_21445 [Phycisphaerales bacterium]
MKAGNQVVTCIAALVCVLFFPGCEDREGQEAPPATAEVGASQSRATADLAAARRQMAQMQEDLAAITEDRDNLKDQVGRLTAERDEALALAHQAAESITSLTSRLSGQGQERSRLEDEINKLTAVIEDQQTTIAEQDAAIAELKKAIEEQAPAVEEPPVEVMDEDEIVEPNEIADEQ